MVSMTIITGQIYNSTDEDWFHYSAAEAGQLQVVFECPTQPTNHSGWSVSIVDSNKTILSSYTVKSNQTIIADLPSSGDYYLVIKTAPLFLGTPTSNYTIIDYPVAPASAYHW